MSMHIRRLSREIALQSLFQFEFLPEQSLERALSAALEEHDQVQGQVALGYARDLAGGTLGNKEDIDTMLQKSLKGWTLERLGTAERNILRLCLYEIYFAPEEERLPVAVAVDEALELGKLYCDDSSPKFMNGLLRSIVGQ